MKTVCTLLPALLLLIGCSHPKNAEEIKKEIFQAEKAFEQMAAEKGIPEAFAHFADENAVINRNDSLISGKENIKSYYAKQHLEEATVAWTPDFIDVSPDGMMGYTYGKYLWKIPNENDSISEFRGTFHTVWKRQADGQWKYVWD